ncbi:chemotaxis protein CheW [Sulfuritalea hydrogenivorans]|jgi:twitching motility protein PilI|uniref:Pilus biogenesis protein n=1 Tax=Sulfuritalea hydrogenivorans sk43H TaxID=1223802 RepID=W0SJC0_9PROT|nr:chemotaxis protein CheW [Sulfuritalea hydrogenivorans]MDK9713694.1 chemotaxis protein CheW [Sulfuritalea sp.]BAO31192.1 pilus biogenesis protein [Sulfuritalea hydrogenivorans sk43H]
MAKRISLREFQQGLSERLVSARRGEGGQALLGVESGADDLPGGSHWLIDLADSGEVSPLPQLTPAPLTKPWFAGIANIRGVLYSVVDFSAWRGGAPTPINAQSRLLLVGARHGINSALLVRRALGLRPQLQMHAAGEARVGAGDTAPWLGGRFKDAQDVTWTQLRIPALLADPNYLDIAL